MEKKPTHIGGQAVIEGVMMRGRKTYTLAVRTPDNSIFKEDVSIEPISNKYTFLKLPIIRGVVSFVESLYLGTKILTKSAEMAGLDEDMETESKFDKFLINKFGGNITNVLMIVSVVFAIILNVVLFMLLPTFVSGGLKKLFNFESHFILSLLESIIKILVFLGFLTVVSKMEDIQRVFMYHGAEHKTINCFENGEVLSVENVRKHSRLHKRCGTSFLFIVIVVSIIVFMFVKVDTLGLRLLSRIILIPFVAGISYEIIRWAGSSDSSLVEIISKPGMMMQYLTTNEPDDDQIEVAIAAMEGVLTCELRQD